MMLKGLFTIAAAILVALLVWGVLVEPRLIDTKYEIAEVPGLPTSWENRRVAVIADLQIGMWLDNEGTVERIVDRVKEVRPALVLIAGDFIYHPLGEETQRETREELGREEYAEGDTKIQDAVKLVQPLAEAGLPTYAVLGNHDYGMESKTATELTWIAERLEASLEDVGIEVLQNESLVLPGRNAAASGPPLYLVGVGSHYANNDRPSAALSEVPEQAPRLALMHHPDSFAAFPAETAPFAVAGHTHGGQIRLPGRPDWSWLALVQTDEVTIDGWIEDYGRPGNSLYVNRGIGFSLIPVRINARPELTFFTLRRAEQP